MKNVAKLEPKSALHIKIRNGKAIAMGPGKADLLAAIRLHGSISAAAKHMSMSYRRAWQLVDVMNTCFKAPLVSSMAGGQHGGGAQLTPFGEQVLTHYHAIQTKANLAASAELAFMMDSFSEADTS